MERRGLDAYGNSISTVLYGISLLPVGEDIRKVEPEVVQPWFADDVAMAGPSQIAAIFQNQ